MSRLSNQNKIIVGVLSLFLILIVGYAIFSESINIGGTASTGSSDFNIIFNSVGTIKEEGSSGATATISSNKKSLTVMVPKLEYPSAYVEVPVVIKNAGSVTAKIVGIETVGLDNPDIKVTYSGIAQNDRMAPNEEKNMKIKVLWDESSTNTSASASFTITLNYEQDTQASETTTSSVISNNCTSFEKKDTYNVGDVIAICNNDTGKSEDFYVIKDNGDTVTALAKYNLLVGNTSNGGSDVTPIDPLTKGYGLQSSTAKGYLSNDANRIGTIAFSKTYYWSDRGLSYPADVYDENSSLYEPVENYENYLKTTLGKTSVDARLITYNELVGLGCSNSSCGTAPLWVYDTTYWSASASSDINVWRVGPSGRFSRYYGDDNSTGVRPIITISKSDL